MTEAECDFVGVCRHAEYLTLGHALVPFHAKPAQGDRMAKRWPRPKWRRPKWLLSEAQSRRGCQGSKSAVFVASMKARLALSFRTVTWNQTDRHPFSLTIKQSSRCFRFYCHIGGGSCVAGCPFSCDHTRIWVSRRSHVMCSQQRARRTLRFHAVFRLCHHLAYRKTEL